MFKSSKPRSPILPTLKNNEKMKKRKCKMELSGVGWQTIGLSSAELIKGIKIKQISTTKGNPH